MPGAYIHKNSQFDWLKQQKESVLSVPGSYWLCHKNSIYKFTFRYHRSIRNATEFAYGKELMKVIRKIIKSQPRQGQQFSTEHILVTYNHTSWTRQDKMFAILKFREHTEVSTVSRAIVLTVKVFKNQNSIPTDKIYHTNTVDKAITSLMHTKQDYSSQDTKNNESINIDSSNDDELKMSCDDAVKNINNINNFNLNYNFNDLSLPTNINNSDIIDKSKITKHNRRSLINKSVNIETKDIHKNEDCSISWEEVGNKKYQCHNNTEISPVLNQFEFDETEQEKNKVQQISTTSDDINSTNDESMVDSANLPYQYLIEKEIENEKKRIIPLLEINKSISTHTKNEFNTDSANKPEVKHIKKMTKENYKYNKDYMNKGTLETKQNKEEEHTNNIKYISVDSKHCDSINNETVKTNCSNYKSIGESQKNINIDDNASKSSNITDLIMKGCMFTIQQDKDSVSVLEQETKSEVDEVLENSEKVETKEGDKCLLNTSLLKLENLVTMIETPKETTTSNCANKIAYDNNRFLHSTLLTKDYNGKQHTTKWIVEEVKNDEAEERSSILELEKRNNESIDSENQEASSSCESFYVKDDVHSAELQNNCLQSNLSLDSHKTIFEDYMNNSNFKLVETSTDTNLNHTSNTPRIISNEIITVDQMPLKLRKIIKKKLLGSNTFANCKHQSHSQDTQLCSAQLELFSKSVKVKEKYVDQESKSDSTTSCADTLSIGLNINATEETTVSRGKRKKPHDYDAESNNDKVQSDEMISIQQKADSPLDKVERHKRRKKQDCRYCSLQDTEKKVRKPTHKSRIVKKKYSTMPNKLQDITKEFYQDLVQHHIHNENVDCISHRQTRQSFFLDTKTENENIRIEMLKFIEDITRGVKVVIKRMSTKSISNILGKNSPLAYIN